MQNKAPAAAKRGAAGDGAVERDIFLYRKRTIDGVVDCLHTRFSINAPISIRRLRREVMTSSHSRCHAREKPAELNSPAMSHLNGGGSATLPGVYGAHTGSSGHGGEDRAKITACHQV